MQTSKHQKSSTPGPDTSPNPLRRPPTASVSSEENYDPYVINSYLAISRDTAYDSDRPLNYGPPLACLQVEIYAFKSERHSSRDCEHLWLFAEVSCAMYNQPGRPAYVPDSLVGLLRQFAVALYRPNGLPVAPTIGGAVPDVMRPGDSFTQIWRFNLDWTKSAHPMPTFTSTSRLPLTSRGRVADRAPGPNGQKAIADASSLAQPGSLTEYFHLCVGYHHTSMPPSHVIQINTQFQPHELLRRGNRDVRFEHMAAIIQAPLHYALRTPQDPFDYLAVRKSSESVVVSLLEEFGRAAEPYLGFLRLGTLRQLHRRYEQEFKRVKAEYHVPWTAGLRRNVVPFSTRRLPVHLARSRVDLQQENSPIARRRNSIDLSRSDLDLDGVLDDLTNSSPSKQSRGFMGGLRKKLSTLRVVNDAVEVPAPLFSPQESGGYGEPVRGD